MPAAVRPHLAGGPRGAHVVCCSPTKGAVNPLLQRLLISWAAGAAATGVVVGTAKRPHRLKRRRRKKKKGQQPEPVQIGAQALLDARAPADPGMSVEDWTAGVKALPGRFASIFSRVPKGPADGAREPDEIRTADGQKVSAGTRKKRRRRGKRQKATLWDSAKESMRQTVHEVVKEEVKDTPVGNAVDAARKAGDKVKEGAAVVKEGAAVVAENAVKVGAQVGDKAKSLLNRILHAVEADPASNADPDAEALAEHEQHAAEQSATAAPSEPDPAPHTEGTAPTPPTISEPPPAAVDVAEVGRKVKSGLNAVGDWLSGPGAPGYQSKRVKAAQGGGDVVEAKDAGAESVAPTPASVQPVPVHVQQVGEDQGADPDRPEDDDGAERRRDEAGE